MKGYKTLILNGAVAVAPIVDLAINNGAVISALTGGEAATVLSVLSLANIVLRWVTTTPIFKTE